MRFSVVVPAAGSGARFGGDLPKQFLPLGGRPLLAHALRCFESMAEVDRIVVAASVEQIERLKRICEDERYEKVRATVGGESRAESVRNALDELARLGCASDDVVAIHDAVRPFVSIALVERLLGSFSEGVDGVIPVLQPTETIHRVIDGVIVETPARVTLGSAQTPQCFRLSVVREALRGALGAGMDVTDEAVAVVRAGYKVRVVEGEPDNIKVTRVSDFEFAERLLGTKGV